MGDGADNYPMKTCFRKLILLVLSYREYVFVIVLLLFKRISFRVSLSLILVVLQIWEKYCQPVVFFFQNALK